MRRHGRLDPDDPSLATITEGTISAARLDLDTGEPVWQVDLGAWLGAYDVDFGMAQDADSAIVTQAEALAMLDLQDGSLEELDWDSGPCTTTVRYEYAAGSQQDADLTTYTGGEAVFACGPDHSPTSDGPVPELWVQLAGLEAPTGGWVVATVDGLAFYDLTPAG